MAKINQAAATRIPLTENAKVVLEQRYLEKNDQGEVIETPEEMFSRVAGAVAKVEPKRKDYWAKRYYEFMASLRFLPNSPTLMNAGKKSGQLSACFVLPVEDSLPGIFDSLKSAALIHQSGGGTGFSFSRLRPKGSLVRTSHGVASGPVSFMKIFDTATETIKQGGTRRGANMGILRVDHPDIIDFIDCKRDLSSILNFNISVGITDKFMEALANETSYEILDPRSQSVLKNVSAKDVFNKIVEAAWESGDPGLVFLNRINVFNPTPGLGDMESTNPCGEQPLLPYESCNLGSLNLSAFVTSGKFDWDYFRADIHLAVRFLDSVIDANVFPLKECKDITLRNRKIGLGVMGFADALLLLGLPYDSESARKFGEQLMSFLDREGKIASQRLAQEKGAFKNWKGSLWDRLRYPKLRNATVSTVAPTGTISMIAGVSSGIEPVFSGIFFRNVLSGKRLTEIHPAVKKILDSKKINAEALSESEISKALGQAWTPASWVSVENHVRMQAVFQRHSDSAVSKTINLPKEATLLDVKNAYVLAYRLGCKGITIYRDQSRESQVLERPKLTDVRSPGESCPSC